LYELFNSNETKWDLIIAHFLGVDHCGHSFGPNNIEIKRKLKDIDNTIEFVSQHIDNETLLVIIGDHGMTETGDHGGDSQLELETALFFYSKKKLFTNNSVKYLEEQKKSVIIILNLILSSSFFNF
jgi:GPI ethanolamine phosphate transferase 3 subunit O